VVAQGDEEALFLSMRELMLDPEMRERFGAAAQEVAAKFSWESTVDRLETIYHDVLKR
jgi:glycosyltransferase involved in cell wall biosynthesis